MSPARGAVRLGRAAVLGTCCLLLALTAHVLAGGAAPGPLALAVLAVPVACLSVLVTGGPAGAYRIGLVLAATQVGLHEAFMLTAQAHCAPAASSAAGLGALAPMTGAHAHGAAGAVAGACAPAMTMPPPSLAMLAGHVVAAAVTGLLLAHGERLLWAFLTWLAGPLPTAAPGRLAPTTDLTLTVPVRRVLRPAPRPGGVGLRGPPLPATA